MADKIYKVQDPTGAIREISGPDGASDDEVIAQAQKLFSQPKSDISAATPTPLGQRFMRGLRDPLDAGAQLLTRALPKNLVEGVNAAIDLTNKIPIYGDLARKMGVTSASPEQIDSGIKEREAAYTKPSGIDWARLGGNMVTTAPLAALGPVPQTMKQAAGIGAGMGALYGAFQPVTENQDSFGKEKMKQIGTSAVAGAVAGPVMQGVANAVSPRVRPDVRALLDEGVTPTPGQIIGGIAQRTEDKLTSVPILGDSIKYAQRKAIEDMNRAVYARALNPIGGKVPETVGREAVDDVATQLSGAYDKLLPKLSFKADPVFSQELSTVTQMAQQLPTEQAGRFQNILREQLIGKLTPQGNASGETIKAVESELGRLANGYRGDASFDNRQLGAALSEVQAMIRRTLERTNPQFAQELANINQGYAAFTRLRDAAAMQGANNGIFTPAQLSAAVRAGDKSLRHGSFARGNALMQDLSDPAKAVLSQTIPDSGTIGRGLLGGSLLGGSAMAGHPEIPLALGGASLPYLPGGRQITAGLLARRPDFAEPVANAIRSIPMGLLAPGLYQASQ
jgi:hypothetical protein